MSNKNRRFIAEWEPQSAVMIALPHEATDWNYMLPEVEACYVNLVKAILKYENLIIISNKEDYIKNLLGNNHKYNYKVVACPTNDTWCRDFGAISVETDNGIIVCDFKFNAWGGKFNWELDNMVTTEMNKQHVFQVPIENCQDFILEGGSIETDGEGTLLVTSQCLLTPTRNQHMNKEEIEKYLCDTLGVTKVLWLDHGAFAGDDTDSHIDTLARLAPNSTIIYAGCDDIEDEHYQELKEMKEQLSTFTDVHDNKFRLLKLPFPNAIYDENGERLPATYANYLIVNNAVLVPTYNQPENDSKALDIISKAFPNRIIEGVDCNALIKQHGSLHCVTMQFPKNVINI